MQSSSKDPEEALGQAANTGLAATLRLAAAKGYIGKEPKRPVVLNSAKKAKLEARSYTIEEKMEDKSRHNLREVKDPEYKPEINLEYTDDAGRKLNTPKEAFKYMCHKFHGNGPGKNKIDKQLRKEELKNKSRREV